MHLLEGPVLEHNSVEGKMKKVGKRRKKPSIRRYYNPRPPDYKACALPLCYNHCPKCILMLLIPRLFFCSEWDIAKQNCWSVGTRDFSGDMAPRQANMFQPTARLSHLQRHLMAFKMVSCKSPQLHIYIHFFISLCFLERIWKASVY